jgi:protease PrsW
MRNEPFSAAAPPIVMRSGNTSAIRVVLAAAAVLIALFLGLLVLLLIGTETGPVGLIVGLVAATIPVPLYVVLVLWIDRYEAEPTWMLITAFLWGALVAVFIALLLNTVSGLTVEALTHNAEAAETFAAVVSAPIVEECAKAFILVIFFFWKKDEFDGVIDGLVYAAMVGLGFATTENIQYYGRAVLAGGAGLTPVFIVRGMFAPFSHPLFTGLTGIGLGLARQSQNLGIKLVTPVVGLIAAIFMHSIWNGSADIFGGLVFLLTYIVIMVPAFLLMLLVIVLGLRREGLVVRDYLASDFHSGLLTRQEYDQFCTVRGRLGASVSALSRGGLAQWRTSRRLNQMASELAFHRSRVARGIGTKDAAAREREYLEALRELLGQWRPN